MPAISNNYNIKIRMDEAELYERERQVKQDYLKEQIVDRGYNTGDFAQYLLEQRGGE
jgi:hypothetical protein